MMLSQLLTPLKCSCTENPVVTMLTCDSQQVMPGALFIAMTGAQLDGHDYISDAIQRGAVAIICERAVVAPIPVITHPNPRQILGLLAAEFFGHPAAQMKLIAITGTKGKTTTAHMVRDILMAAGYTVGMIGTLGSFVGRELIDTGMNTTPEPITLHRQLREMADRGCTCVVLEASSQAMKLHRLQGILFDAALFLNLSFDHIGENEHADFDEYRSCKAALFRQCRLAVGNAADANWSIIAAEIPDSVQTKTFGTPHISPGPGLTSLLNETYNVALPGDFNGQNALAALTLCQALSIPDAAIHYGLAHVSVPGRTQLVSNNRGITILIDYAHNGDSFRSVLTMLKTYPHRRIIVVFGAGGNRPKLRRQDMADAVAEGADFAVITADNPRTERAEDICRDIADALAGRIPCVEIYDRRQAIFFALDAAQKGDIVALLGKGHEQYIEINGVRQQFSELAVIDEYFCVR